MTKKSNEDLRVSLKKMLDAAQDNLARYRAGTDANAIRAGEGMVADLEKMIKAALKQLLTIPFECGTIKIMERDFWNRIRLLGHVTLLVSPQIGLIE